MIASILYSCTLCGVHVAGVPDPPLGSPLTPHGGPTCNKQAVPSVQLHHSGPVRCSNSFMIWQYESRIVFFVTTMVKDCSCFLIEINWSTMYPLNTSPRKTLHLNIENTLHPLYSTVLSRTTNRIPKQVYIGDKWSLVTMKWSLQDRWATKDPHQKTNEEWNGAR